MQQGDIDKIVESGFKHLERKEGDTLENTLKIIEEHFILLIRVL